MGRKKSIEWRSDDEIDSPKYKYGKYGDGKKKGSKKMDVICNNCEHEFAVKPYIIENIKSKDPILVEGFICPNCNKRYITKITNNELRANLAKTLSMKNELVHQQRLIRDEAQEYIKIGKYTKEIQDRLNNQSNKLIQEYKMQVMYNKRLEQEVRELYYKYRGCDSIGNK